jgi:pimeloyl-ACP methyl ester carboxylesterase
MSTLFAATHPERVSALILYGTSARETWAPGYPWGPTEEEYRQSMRDGVEAFRSDPNAFIAELIRPGAPDATDAEVAAYLPYFRQGTTPAILESLYRMNLNIDVRQVLPALPVLTLVIRHIHDPWGAAENGRYIAAQIPTARYVELSGNSHLLMSRIDPC